MSVRDMRQVSTYTENLYEYHGIRRVWEVARTCHQSTLILYFHGKGMANGQHSVIKDYVNEMLTTVGHTSVRMVIPCHDLGIHGAGWLVG